MLPHNMSVYSQGSITTEAIDSELPFGLTYVAAEKALKDCKEDEHLKGQTTSKLYCSKKVSAVEILLPGTTPLCYVPCELTPRSSRAFRISTEVSMLTGDVPGYPIRG